eukprot:2644000-Prymnesium_polylepis.1
MGCRTSDADPDADACSRRRRPPSGGGASADASTTNRCQVRTLRLPWTPSTPGRASDGWRTRSMRTSSCGRPSPLWTEASMVADAHWPPRRTLTPKRSSDALAGSA